MKIISQFLREQRRYTKNEIASLFELDDDEVREFLKTLKAYNVLKAVRNTPEQREMTDLVDEDVQTADEASDNDMYLYAFVYVGIIVFGRRILKIYPKYLLSASEPLDEMKLVLKVLEKYSGSEKQIINLYNGDGTGRSFNLLAVLLFLINDYYEYGLYSNSEDVTEVNGEGPILWEKTINENFALISENHPYYMEMFTRKTADDEEDYFRRLHKTVLTECSEQLDESQLSELFETDPIYLSDEKVEDFGERECILDRILNELSVQFSTRKQILLKTIYTYISQDRSMLDENEGISMYGTTAFNLVWEKACGESYSNRLQSKLGALPLPRKLSAGYDADDKLIDIIERPAWVGVGYTRKAGETLIPDTVTIDESNGDICFVIMDAKYYNLQMEPSRSLRGQPGIESVTKQYLYQLAYRKFISDNGIPSVRNCFLMPTEKGEIINKGYVELKMLHDLDLENIEVILLPAERVFESYITGRKMKICDLKL